MRNEIIDLVDNAKSGESENQKVEDSADRHNNASFYND